MALTACAAAEHHAASRVAVPPPAFGSARATLRRQNRPPVARATGRGGRAQRGYVHTNRNISEVVADSEGWELTRTVDKERDLLRRRRARAVCSMYHTLRELGRDKEAKALIACGRWFIRESLPCGSYRLRPVFCDSMFCPDCANRRSKPLQKRIVRHVKKHRKTRDYWLLTLTRRNISVITRDDNKLLVEWFNVLRTLLFFAAWVTGGVYSREATYSKQTGWHPHLHVLIETQRNLPRWWIFAVQTAWWFITGGSHVVNLRRVYGVKKSGQKTREINMRSIRELVKYATKSADFCEDAALVDQFIRAFKGQRRIQAFGSFANYEKEARREAAIEKMDARERAELEGTGNELAGCACGTCKVRDWQVDRYRLVHISETETRADGSRQLRLFPELAGHDPPRVREWDEIFELTPEQIERERIEQRRLVFRESQGGCEGLLLNDYRARQRLIVWPGLLTYEKERELLSV